MNRATTPPYLLGGCHPASLRPWGKGAGGGTCHQPPPPGSKQNETSLPLPAARGLPSSHAARPVDRSLAAPSPGYVGDVPVAGLGGARDQIQGPPPSPNTVRLGFLPLFCLPGGGEAWVGFPFGGALLLLQSPGHVPGSQTGPSIPGMLSTGQAPASASAVPCGHPAVPIVAIPLCPGVRSPRHARGRVPLPGAEQELEPLLRLWAPPAPQPAPQDARSRPPPPGPTFGTALWTHR